MAWGHSRRGPEIRAKGGGRVRRVSSCFLSVVGPSPSSALDVIALDEEDQKSELVRAKKRSWVRLIVRAWKDDPEVCPSAVPSSRCLPPSHHLRRTIASRKFSVVAANGLSLRARAAAAWKTRGTRDFGRPGESSSDVESRGRKSGSSRRRGKRLDCRVCLLRSGSGPEVQTASTARVPRLELLFSPEVPFRISSGS